MSANVSANREHCNIRKTEGDREEQMTPTPVLIVHQEAYEATTQQNFIFRRLFLSLPFHRSVAIKVSGLCNALCKTSVFKF